LGLGDHSGSKGSMTSHNLSGRIGLAMIEVSRGHAPRTT
jgi:hypothetical protein